MFKKISQNFVKSPIKCCLISQILDYNLWHVCLYIELWYIDLVSNTIVLSLFYHIMNASICPSSYILQNHWAEFKQICYMTSPHGKGVWEQQYFSVHPSVWHRSICPSHYLLNHWAKFNQTCYMTSPHSKDVCEQYYFSIRRLSVWGLSIYTSCYLLSNH